MRSHLLHCSSFALCILSGALVGAPSGAQEGPLAVLDQPSQKLLLSGSGPSDAVRWGFRVNSGRQAGLASEIPVPSQWQQQGFGTYAYGQQRQASGESALYTRGFRIPDAWSGRRIELVFGGVMTDTTVLIDGQQVGPTHQGGFTQFRYDVTDFVAPGKEHALAVRVDAASRNTSVNAAEREADYWIFGGIYRPVWLEAHPAEHIAEVRVDARADGTLTVELACEVTARRQVEVQVLTRPTSASAARPVAIAAATSYCSPAEPATALHTIARGVLAWSAETPHLYDLRLNLRQAPEPRTSDGASSAGKVLHTVERTTGFRTVEVRRDGLFVNGSRTVLKGINRHSFWPATARALDVQRNRADVELLRSLNFNAVRTAHSPPDQSFLEACDELGLYVVDELPGWHDAYDTRTGREILREMVRRDQHHPSVILWSNGNEGGWNRSLDRLFSELDPQQRPVLHPWSIFGGFQTTHYPDWADLVELTGAVTLQQRLARARFGELPLLLPTEILHSLYDGGGGASLDAYWQLLQGHPRFSGLFLWSLFDEGLLRPEDAGSSGLLDRGELAAAPDELPAGWMIDTFGNYAADGILDAWRRPEGSAAVVREVFSPVSLELAVDLPDPSSPHPEAPTALWLVATNHFDHLDLSQVHASVEWLRLPSPLAEHAELRLLHQSARPLPPAPPGHRASLLLEVPPSVAAAGLHDLAVRLTLRRDDRSFESPFAQQVFDLTRDLVEVPAPRTRASDRELQYDATTRATTPELTLRLDDRGRLLGLEVAGRDSGISGGTTLWAAKLADPASQGATAGKLAGDRSPPRELLLSAPSERRFVDDQGVLRTWTVRPDGWIKLHVFSPHLGAATAIRRAPIGLQFAHQDLCSATMAWLGRGPHRIWGNRRGGVFDVWQRPLQPLCASGGNASSALHELNPTAGLYDARWLRLETPQGILTLLPGLQEAIALGPATFPDDARTARSDIPAGLTVYGSPPAIGTKFHHGDRLQPAADPPPALVLWLHFAPTLQSSEETPRGDQDSPIKDPAAAQP